MLFSLPLSLSLSLSSQFDYDLDWLLEIGFKICIHFELS